MSLNWVMLNGLDFVRLPGEKTVYQSPPRTSLSLSTPKTYPAASGSVSVSSDSGTLYLTNQRVVYVPAKSTPTFQSFSAPLLKLHDTHITVPWFGPNAWIALVEPVPGGNLPAVSTGIELKLTFKEGGAPDFHSSFERIKERLQQAVESARDSGVVPSGGRQGGFVNGVNMDAVHLDQLPSYEASSHDRMAAAEADSDQAAPTTTTTAPATTAATGQQAPLSPTPPSLPQQSDSTQQHSDAPPGYEETQSNSIQQELDRRLSGL